ncbi:MULTISPECIES: toll/interleukin-1 receptor domain-containing protein [Streptomyces]|uniref:Toll/interleukin-1 receptor domain-containing protein n=1 Tax=Streptomyces mirabilis TaxID=68239 RepID=A0ABU3URX5_9ACTN|nr:MULTISPECIES: toll/interleukin-1 receptor domain-containing protein [Streptomyces]MCX4609649.1 toll/interleukin-1 receptor domain-containing protein [Streptomyces mirabilis]MCX5349930.1 toll/interleukin-1 receptor domain-containing protein [Streptomyces mirabilis]MDU8996685.1 toll/interleukin-1 receptor domain-containing protein [Streptomyces mirabilis]QDN88348.1 toll/interleukin-1 receptor domain-containing protein [Streptomyces sp. RLB3-6]QDO09200.1 toll/interleukin-1 receptor domain-cont
MDRDGLRARPDHDWQQAVVQALCDSPVLGDRGARAMLAELIGDRLGRPVVLREQATTQLQLLELVRFCVREEIAANHGLSALADAVSLLEGHSRTADAVSELVREHVVREHAVPEHVVRENVVGAAPPHDPSHTDRLVHPVHLVHLFLSCAVTDLAWASWIAWHLEDAGVGLRLDLLDGPLSGLEQRGPEQYERVLAVLSPAYVGSAPVQQAWQAVHRRNPEGIAELLVPVMVERCRPPWPLSTVAYTDLTGLGEDAARTRLLDAVGVTRTAPTRHAAPPRFPDPAGRR